MGFKAIYEKKEDIPQGLEDYFDLKDGKYVLQKVEGLRSDADFTRIDSALKKERADHKATKAKLKALPEGFDAEKYAEEQSELEELRLKVGESSDENIEKMVEVRLKRKLGPVERERDKLKGELAESQKRTEDLQQSINTGLINDSIRKAATKVKIHPTAIEDAQLLGRSSLKLTDDGKVLTEDGQTAEEWLASLTESRAHWFPNSTPGGASGGGGTPGNVNPWASQHWNITAQSKIAAEKGVEYATKLAERAGSSFGATTPPPSKK